MIDTHAHLDFPEFDQDREEVISRFFSQNGKAIVNIGVDLERSRKSVEIAEAHENVYAAVGLHPDYFMNYEVGIRNYEKELEELKNLAKNKKVIAIGETGLDYFSHTDNLVADAQKENQKEGFVAQIELARELNLPVVVHCRDAWDDLFEIIKSQTSNSNIQQNPKPQIQKKIPNTKYKIRDTNFVLHCYSGNQKDTEKFLKLPNVYFSFSGNITYPKPVDRADRLAEAVRTIPLDKIMLDSDSPFLAPQEMRGKRNEPIFVKYIVKKISQIKNVSEKEVETATDGNAKEFFGMKE
jgi:TatD DNase family protein